MDFRNPGVTFTHHVFSFETHSLLFSYRMFDFSSFHFSTTRTGLCSAIFVVALLAGMRDLLRLHTLAHKRITSPNIGPAGPARMFTQHRFNFAFLDFFDENSEWEIRPLTGKISVTVLAVPVLAIGLLVCSETMSVRLQAAIDAGTSVVLCCHLHLHLNPALTNLSDCFALNTHMLAAASAGQRYFDAFNTEILDPATSSQIFITLLVFLACWDLIISFTTGPALGPILRGIIQARALTGIFE